MSHGYFNRLNYTLGNEDTALELAVLPTGVEHVFSVCGSGSRVIPLLAKAPKNVTVCDVAEPQLFLAEMRLEAVRTLTFEEFGELLGYPPHTCSPEKRRDLFYRLRISSPAQKFLIGLFESLKWNSLLYEGGWEQTFQKLFKINRFFTGTRAHPLFDCKTISEQEDFLASGFPRLGWALCVSLLGNASVFNALLYKGHFAKKNISESYHSYYMHAFNRLFRQAPARTNYFLQLCFLGGIHYAEGNLIECQRPVFDKMKHHANSTDVRFVVGDVITTAAKQGKKINFYSLSDVPSYFSGERERDYLEELSQGLAPGAIVVNRYYLRVPEQTRKSGYEDITARFGTEIAAEKVQMYDVEILRWRGR